MGQAGTLKVGDRVRVIGMPGNLPPDGDIGGLNTTTLIRRCVGRVFPIVGFNDAGWVELEVGAVTGQESYMSSIWIEPEFLAMVGKPD